MKFRWWNFDWSIVFQTVILQRACHVTTSHAIRRRIKKRLDAWETGRYGIIVEDTMRTCEQYLSAARREESHNHREKTYYSLALRGKL